MFSRLHYHGKISSALIIVLLCHLQVPLGLAITWAIAFLLTETGVYSYKGCGINVPPSNTISAYCRKHVPRMKHCRLDTSHALSSSPWFRFPYPLQWGTPLFNWKIALVMCAVSIIASVDSVCIFWPFNMICLLLVLSISMFILMILLLIHANLTGKSSDYQANITMSIL